MAIRRKKFITKKAGTDDVVALDVNDVSFPCNSKIPGMVLVDFISEMDEDNPSAMGKSLTGFLKAAIREDAHEAFFEYCRVPENDVDLDALAEMAGWLAEQYSGENPTAQSPVSSDGLPTTGIPSLETASGLA